MVIPLHDDNPTSTRPYVTIGILISCVVVYVWHHLWLSDVGTIQAARRLGYTGPILGSDGLTGLKDAGAAAEGVFVSSAFLPDRPTDLARQFVTRYRERYRALPDHRGAMTYDVINLLKRAIQSVGTDRAALREYVSRIGVDGGSPAFEGVSGTIRFDRNGDVVGKTPTLGVVRGGQLVTARQ